MQGFNLFIYCGNDPVNRIDSSGADSEKNSDIDLDDDEVTERGGSGSGYHLASNPIDQGYTYKVNLSQAANSSSFSGGILTNGYSAGGIYEDPNANGPSACFVAGTFVQSESGMVPIEEIKAGDSVYAWDEATGDVALKKVVETYISQSDELIHIFVSGEEIITTPTHPFYSPVKGWTSACKLRAGDILVTVNGEYVVVEKVQHEILEAPVTVYNFQVEGYHTYYVSYSSVLVHNSCSSPNRTTEWDIHYNSKGQVKVGDATAQYDGHYYWLRDTAGHGGSAYKVYDRHGKHLYWVHDADRFGNFIEGKHKSDSGKVRYIG